MKLVFKWIYVFWCFSNVFLTNTLNPVSTSILSVPNTSATGSIPFLHCDSGYNLHESGLLNEAEEPWRNGSGPNSGGRGEGVATTLFHLIFANMFVFRCRTPYAPESWRGAHEFFLIPDPNRLRGGMDRRNLLTHRTSVLWAQLRCWLLPKAGRGGCHQEGFRVAFCLRWSDQPRLQRQHNSGAGTPFYFSCPFASLPVSDPADWLIFLY